MEEINGVADEVKTEDPAPTQPREGLHKLKGVTVVCGWAIHVIFCCCSGETIKLPMACNGKVQCVLPIRTMNSTEIEQEEYDEFYESTANNKYGQSTTNTKWYVRRVFINDDFKNMMPSNLSLDKGVVDSDDPPLDISREILQQHMLLMINQKKTLEITHRHPLIREMLRRVEDMTTPQTRAPQTWPL